MTSIKANHRAASASLDGHCRFVVILGHNRVAVFTLYDLAHAARGTRIECAYNAGKLVTPR